MSAVTAARGSTRRVRPGVVRHHCIASVFADDRSAALRRRTHSRCARDIALPKAVTPSNVDVVLDRDRNAQQRRAGPPAAYHGRRRPARGFAAPGWLIGRAQGTSPTGRHCGWPAGKSRSVRWVASPSRKWLQWDPEAPTTGTTVGADTRDARCGCKNYGDAAVSGPGCCAAPAQAREADRDRQLLDPRVGPARAPGVCDISPRCNAPGRNLDTSPGCFLPTQACHRHRSITAATPGGCAIGNRRTSFGEAPAPHGGSCGRWPMDSGLRDLLLDACAPWARAG